MDEMMFQEAQANMLDLMQEYSDRQDATVEIESDPLGFVEDEKDEFEAEDGDEAPEEEAPASAAAADDEPAVDFDESDDDEI